MKRISARSAAFSVLLAAPFLMVGTVRAGTAVDIGADVSLGFHVGEADVNVFYDALAPYGDWVDTSRYGRCWAPREVEQHWRPYYYGHWVYTDDYGWMWVGDEEWGWAAYHYGRWAFDPAYGWVWVPGSVWAPAWVAWRYGDGYAGWAPLPPEADPSMGQADFGIAPLSFVFVEERYLPEPVLVDRYLPSARNVTIVNGTRNVTNYRVVNNQVVNHGVPVEAVERVTGRAVPRVRVAGQTAPARTTVRGNEVAIYRPPVPMARAGSSRAGATTPRPPVAAPLVTTDPAELQRKHAQEQQALQAKEAQERDQLRRMHEQEKAALPANVSQQQLQARQREEERAQAEHEQRQKQVLEQRQARERQAAEQQRRAHQQAQGRQTGQGHQQQPKNDKEKKKPENEQ